MEQIKALSGLGDCLRSWRTGDNVNLATAKRLMPCEHNNTKSDRDSMLS
jgi:hypothetical protein